MSTFACLSTAACWSHIEAKLGYLGPTDTGVEFWMLVDEDLTKIRSGAPQFRVFTNTEYDPTECWGRIRVHAPEPRDPAAWPPTQSADPELGPARGDTRDDGLFEYRVTVSNAELNKLPANQVIRARLMFPGKPGGARTDVFWLLLKRPPTRSEAPAPTSTTR